MPISIANTPHSWGIHRNTVSRYTVAEILTQIAETDYQGVELDAWGFLRQDPAALHSLLQTRGLRLAEGILPVRLTDANVHASAEEEALALGSLIKPLGGQLLVLLDDGGDDPALQHEAGRVRNPRLTGALLETVANGVNRIARRVFDELGLRTAIYPHCATHIESEAEVHNLMALLDVDSVGLCLDTGHWHYAGGDAVAALQHYGPRVWHVHFSDCDPYIRQFSLDEQLTFYEATQAGVFPELGEGAVNFPELIENLRALHYQGWVVVEQDTLLNEPDANRVNARANREYLRRLGL